MPIDALITPPKVGTTVQTALFCKWGKRIGSEKRQVEGGSDL